MKSNPQTTVTGLIGVVFAALHLFGVGIPIDIALMGVAIGNAVVAALSADASQK